MQAGDLPELPDNAEYVKHANECYDWGTFGWAIREGIIDPGAYKYFIFLNSSVRGPFLPPYLKVGSARFGFSQAIFFNVAWAITCVAGVATCNSYKFLAMGLI